MALSLTDFCGFLRSDVDAFENHWKEMHEKDSEKYPLIIGDDNEGIWAEMFQSFCDDRMIEYLVDNI